MAPRRQPLNDEQRRLLRITGRMPLASVANLASTLGATEDRVRAMLGRLRSGGWVSSVLRGMTERRQHRFFLTSRAVDLLYTTDHQHPGSREAARATGLAAFHPEGELPADFRERFALDHDHQVHLENQAGSPFNPARPIEDGSDGADHEHPPWTATSRGVEMSLRRLAMLEPVYRLAPDLLQSGRVNWPVDNTAASREVRMTDFRLLRRGGFYQAVARYGEQVWTPFTYAGIHATERVIRRKEQHRFWGVDCYSAEEDRYLRIGNRTFYEDPDQEVETLGPGGCGRGTPGPGSWHATPSPVPLPPCSAPPTAGAPRRWNCVPQGTWFSDPSGHPVVGRPEAAEVWLRQNPDVSAIDGRLAHRLFLTICQFPAMRASWLSEVAGGSPREVSRHLGAVLGHRAGGVVRR